MKVILSLVVTAFALQTAYSYVISPFTERIISGPILAPSPCACTQEVILPQPQVILPQPQVIVSPPPVIAASVCPSNSVANSLADTLSLLTVSSLLAETLPLPAVVPVAGLPLATYNPCGYGCGCGGIVF